MSKAQISGRLVSSGINDVALSSLYRSEEVDDYNNWRMSESCETLSGLFNRESRYICNSLTRFCGIYPKNEGEARGLWELYVCYIPRNRVITIL